MELIEYSSDIPSPSVTNRNQFLIVLGFALLMAVFLFFKIWKEKKAKSKKLDFSDFEERISSNPMVDGNLVDAELRKTSSSTV